MQSFRTPADAGHTEKGSSRDRSIGLACSKPQGFDNHLQPHHQAGGRTHGLPEAHHPTASPPTRRWLGGMRVQHVHPDHNDPLL